MTTLVTGATGFIGYHAARLLTQRGESIRVLTRPLSRRDNLDRLDNRLVEVVCGDLKDSATLLKAVDGCEMIYHAAADYRLWSRNPEELYQTNVGGVRNLLEAAQMAGVKRVVYTSTVGALGIPGDGSPGNEETPVTIHDMAGHYKRSKFLAEQEANNFAENGLDLVIVNPSTPVGENDIKPTPTGQIVVDFLNRRLPAYIDTGLNLVDVRDVAEGMLLAGEKGEKGRKYILGNRNTSLCELMKMLAHISGTPAPRFHIPYALAWMAVGAENITMDRILHREPTHPFEGVKMARHKMYFDGSRAVQELGMPQSPVEYALERAVDWFQSNGYVRT